MGNKSERLLEDLNINKRLHLSGNKYHAIYKTLHDLEDYDENYGQLLDFFYSLHKKEVDRFFEINCLGAMFILMKEEGCSQEQTAAFFSEWSGKSTRHVKECLYDYRKSNYYNEPDHLANSCMILSHNYKMAEMGRQKYSRQLLLESPLEWACQPPPEHHAKKYFEKVIQTIKLPTIKFKKV